MNSVKPLEFQATGMIEVQSQQIENAGKVHPKNREQAEKAATDFEALLLHQMLNSMWKTIPKNEFMGGGNEEAQFRDMYTEALAKQIAETQSLGVKDVLLKDFEKNAK